MNSDNQMCLIRSEEEARAIETALRTAVLSVVEVINDINRSRFQDCQRKVTEKDDENAQLKAELCKAEEELAFLRQLVGFQREQQIGGGSVRCNASTDAHVPDSRWSVEIEDGAVNNALSTPQSSVEQSKNHRIDNQFECLSEEATAIPQDSATGSSEHHGHNGPVSTLSGFSENHTDMMNSPVVKEEPPNTDTVYIKFEVKEENVCTDQEGSSPSCVLEREPQEKSRFTHFRDGAFGTRSRLTYRSARLTEDRRLSSVSRVKKRIDDRERQRRYRERIRSDPEKLQAYLEKDRRRYQKKRKPICELPEQIQRQKRAMWREAARRCRARKRNTPLAQWTEPL